MRKDKVSFRFWLKKSVIILHKIILKQCCESAENAGRDRMKTMNLLFSINRGCVHLLQSCLKSIEQNGGAESYEVYVLYSDLTPEDKMVLLATGLKGIEFHFVSVPEELFKGFPVTKR